LTPAAWIALASLALAFMVSVVGVAFKLGQHSQRIAALEEKTKDIGTLAVLSAAIADIKQTLGELKTDLKDLFTGKAAPRRTRTGD